MKKFLLISSSILAALVALLTLTSGTAQAKTRLATSSTSTVAAGAYLIDVTLSSNPPYVDQPFTVTVTPHDNSLALSGKVIAEPGLGTDAVNIPTTLQSLTGKPGILTASVHIPVRGAWNIVIQLNGPKGSGQASIAVTVGAPGAMAPWLAWLIGASPLLFIAIWIWHQRRYRRSLQAQAQHV